MTILLQATPLRRLALSLVAALCMAGCARDPSGVPPDNIPPQVRVTGAPRDGSTSGFKTRIYWTGWDDDGQIDRYEVTVDPPEVFTAEEISHPEDVPGITTEFRRGFGDDTGILRVTKIVDGVPHSFDFRVGTRTDSTFVLDTPDPDSLVSSQGFKPAPTASGVHRIYVRARDDRGAYSDAARIAFTGRTVCPTAFVTFPDLQGDRVLFLGKRVLVNLFGLDPDPPTASSRPAGYYYKLVNLHDFSPKRSLFRAFDLTRLMYQDTPHIPWVYVEGATPQLDLSIVPGEWVFAARAVDVVGAVEPFLEWDRGDNPGNAFKFVATEGGGLPTLDIEEPLLGQYQFRGETRSFQVEAPINTEFKFRWQASAVEYGGRIEAYSWGIDVPDLEASGPGSGWSSWGPVTGLPAPITFPLPGIHVLYVRARDSNGSVTLGTIVMKVFPTPLNRPLLFVDDFLNDRFPVDSQHDAWWQGLLAESGRFAPGDLNFNEMWYESGGDGDRFYISTKPPPLSQMVLYENMIWIVDGVGWCGGITSLFNDSWLGRNLRTYSRLGGKIWIMGINSTMPLRRAELDCNDPRRPFYNSSLPSRPAGDSNYPLGMEPETFAWDVLKLRATDIRNDKETEWYNTLIGVRPFDEENPIFEEMRVDSTKMSALIWRNQALGFCEAIWSPMFLNNSPGFRGVVDSLYKYIPLAEERPDKGFYYTSPYQNRLNAIRWHDPDPARENGRVMWFGFPLYYMKDEAALDTFRRAMDWFNDERPVGNF